MKYLLNELKKKKIVFQQHLIFFLAGWPKGCLNQATKYCTFTVSNNLKENEDQVISAETLS
jgi:hypothetical protein